MTPKVGLIIKKKTLFGINDSDLMNKLVIFMNIIIKSIKSRSNF